MRIVVLYIVLSTGISYSQLSPKIYPSVAEVGINHVNDQKIYGIVFPLKQLRQPTFTIDTVNQLLTLRTIFNVLGHPNQKIFVYKLGELKPTWSRELTIYQQAQVDGTRIIYRNQCTDMTTGEPLWKIDGALWFIDRQKGIGIAQGNNILKGINLENGQTIWTRGKKASAFWSEAIPISDSTILVYNEGIHSINLYTGLSWGYPIKEFTVTYHSAGDVLKNVLLVTGVLFVTAMEFANAGATLLNMSTAPFTGGNTFRTYNNISTSIPIPYGTSGFNKHVVRNLNSNRILYDDKIYFRSKDSVTCVSLSGKCVWSKRIESEWVSSSTIFVQNDTLFLLNTGQANVNSKNAKFGKPYLAAFQINNGKQLYLNLLECGPIQSSDLKKTELTVISSKGIFTYDITQGNLLNKNDQIKKGNFVRADVLYINKNNVFIPLNTLHDYPYVIKDDDKVLIINKNLKWTAEYNIADIFSNIKEHKQYRFFSSLTKTLVTDYDNKLLAEVNVSGSAKIINHTLFDIVDNKLITVSLRGIIY